MFHRLDKGLRLALRRSADGPHLRALVLLEAAFLGALREERVHIPDGFLETCQAVPRFRCGGCEGQRAGPTPLPALTHPRPTAASTPTCPSRCPTPSTVSSPTPWRAFTELAPPVRAGRRLPPRPPSPSGEGLHPGLPC